MESLDELKDMLYDALDEIVEKGSLSAGDLQTVHMITDTIKNIEKICMYDEKYSHYDGDYSNNGDWSARGSYSRGNMATDRMNPRYPRRESYRGRYSRDNGMMEERIQEMLNEGKINSNDKAVLNKALEILRK